MTKTRSQMSCLVLGFVRATTRARAGARARDRDGVAVRLRLFLFAVLGWVEAEVRMRSECRAWRGRSPAALGLAPPDRSLSPCPSVPD